MRESNSPVHSPSRGYQPGAPLREARNQCDTGNGGTRRNVFKEEP
jgi:hypothetical protein